MHGAYHDATRREFYYGAMTWVDDSFGTLLQELELLGVRENTMVVLTGDNGQSTERQILEDLVVDCVAQKDTSMKAAFGFRSWSMAPLS